jgi:hypothetical protein
MKAPPWRTPCTNPLRSRARLIARRTATLSNGGFLWLSTTLSLPFCAISVTTSDGAFFFAVSDISFVISSGIETSSRPACSAASRVPRSVMIGYRMPSR